MKKRTPHLDNLEKCHCNNKDTIDKSKLTSVDTHNSETGSQRLARKVRMNKYTTQYVYTFRDTERPIVPPRNKF